MRGGGRLLGEWEWGGRYVGERGREEGRGEGQDRRERGIGEDREEEERNEGGKGLRIEGVEGRERTGRKRMLGEREREGARQWGGRRS